MAGRCYLFLLSAVFTVILLVHISNAQYPRYRGPQGLVFPDDNGRPRPRPTRPTTTSRPATTSNPNECSCPSTTEYNPVCGTDAISYSNPGKLNCAKRCGKDVAVLHYGNCTPPDPNAPSTTTPSTTTPRRRG